MYDYGARNYDPALGRWMNIDPLAEKFPNMSPYVFCANNPLFYVDPNGMEIVNGETARREDLENRVKLHKEYVDSKYGGKTDLNKKDFATKQEYKDYKDTMKNSRNYANSLKESIATEKNIQTSIDDFRTTDKANFDKANNLTFTDSSGKVQNIDIKIISGNEYMNGGAATRTTFDKNQDGTYKSISGITTTMDFSVVKPISHVLAHEMGHAYGNAQNPTKAIQETTTHDCQDPANRQSFQSKTAMDWQESYDNLKK